MRHTPRSRDLAKAAVSLGTGTATLAAFAATGALAGTMVPHETTTTTSAPTAGTGPTIDQQLLAAQAAQAKADKLAAQIKIRKTELRKLERLITRGKKAARRLHVSTTTSTSSGSTTTKSTTTTTKSSSPPPPPPPAPTSGS